MDTHTDLEASCRNRFDNHGEAFDRASDNYFKSLAVGLHQRLAGAVDADAVGEVGEGVAGSAAKATLF